MTINDLENIQQLGVIRRIGHDEEHAWVQVPVMGEIEVPRHHIRVLRPAGRKNRVVVIRGDDIGKVGLVESTAARYRPSWFIKEHLTEKPLLINPIDLAFIEKF